MKHDWQPAQTGCSSDWADWADDWLVPYYGSKSVGSYTCSVCGSQARIYPYGVIPRVSPNWDIDDCEICVVRMVNESYE